MIIVRTVFLCRVSWIHAFHATPLPQLPSNFDDAAASVLEVANAGYTPYCAVGPPSTQLSLTFPDNQMLSIVRHHSNIWKSHVVGFGNIEQQQYCRTVHLSLEKLSQATLGDSGIINLLEKLLTLIPIHCCFPLGFSQQYESQHDISDKIVYFGWWQHKKRLATRLDKRGDSSLNPSVLLGSNICRSSSRPLLLK